MLDPLISDHYAVTGFMSLSKPNHSKQVVTYRTVKRVDVHQFNRLLSSSNVCDLFSGVDE